MSVRYCILLPAETPLFAHVLWAEKEYFSKHGAQSVQVCTLNSRNAPNDHSVKDAVAGKTTVEEANGLQIIAGVCDPYVTHAHNEIEILAGIIKRLAFLIASPDKIRRGVGALERIRRLSIDGKQTSTTPLAKGEYLNSAWALAHNFDHFMGSAQKKANPDNFFFHIGYHDYGKCPVFSEGQPPTCLEEPQFVITSNIQAAIDATQNPRWRAHCEPITNLFPEWTHVLLSAFIAKQGMSDKEKKLVGGVLKAIEEACYVIHHSSAEIVQERFAELYPKFDTPQKRKALYELLVTERFIPENLTLYDNSLILNEALWQLELHRGVLFRDERVRSLARGKASSGLSQYPPLNFEFLRWAKSTNFESTTEDSAAN